jgi:uncharacterized protein YdeI (YjbR/CyaY-like superfamily)
MDAQHFQNATQWEAWLAEHHADEGGVWLKIAKKHTQATGLTITEALDVALCYGWIDSQRKSLDGTYFLQRYSRRRAKSPWSKINVARVAALTAARRMRAPGVAAVELAKADGRWAAARQELGRPSRQLPGARSTGPRVAHLEP